MNIDKFLGENEIKAKIIHKLKDLQFCRLDVCPEVKYEIVTLYVKMRLHYFAKFLNRNIKKRRRTTLSGGKKNRKLMKISHV